MEPNLFLIGFQKSGTSSLYDLLIRHPQIYGHIGIKDIPCYVDSNKRLIKRETLKESLLDKDRNEIYSKYFKGEEKELRQLIRSTCYWAKIKDNLE